MEVLTRHASVVRTLIPHEPPVMRLLADGQKRIDFFFEVYALYRQFGIEPALKKFQEQDFAESDRLAMARVPKNEYTIANATYWFEHELRQYPAADLNLDVLKAHADNIVPMAGRESHGYPCYEASLELAKKLGLDLIELPGGHVGFSTQPAEFAREFVQALARTGRNRKVR